LRVSFGFLTWQARIFQFSQQSPKSNKPVPRRKKKEKEKETKRKT
jgi:hypothetical protein